MASLIPVGLESLETAWATLPNRKKLALAAKAGAYAEFIGERIYHKAKPTVKRYISGKHRSMSEKRPPSTVATRASKKRKANPVKQNAKTDRLYGFGYHRGLYDNTKTALASEVDYALRDDRTFYADTMSKIAFTSTNVMNGRQRSVIHLSGVKCHFRVENVTANETLCVNWAVVIPKNGTNLTNNPTTGMTSVGDWFRAQGSTTRSRDWSLAVTNQSMQILPINSDEYRVLAHERFILNPTTGTTPGTPFNYSGTNYRLIERYFPINREVRMNDLNDEPDTGIVHMVFWLTPLLSNVLTSTANVARIGYRNVAYFKEVC